MPSTPRWAVPYPAAADPPNGPAQMQAIAEKVDLSAIYGQGLLVDRPTSTGGSPGIQGRVYWATDTQTLYWDTGASWVAIGPSVIADGNITEPKYATDSVSQRALAPDSVGAPELIADSVGTSELAPGAVTSAEVAASLKPSGGAGGSTEALRALGTGAGLAAPSVSPTFSGDVVTDQRFWGDGIVTTDNASRIGTNGMVFTALKYLAVSTNPGAVGAGASVFHTVTFPASTCLAGNPCHYVGADTLANLIAHQGSGYCPGNDQANVRLTNHSGSSINPGSLTMRFIVYSSLP